MNNNDRWISVKENDFEEIENFLREHENFCTAPAAKFKMGLQKSDKVWKLCNENNFITALLLYSNRAVYPVFNNIDPVPVPYFWKLPLLQNPVYAIQGCGNDVLQIEKMLASRGKIPSDPKDFFLMQLDALPSFPKKNDSKIIIRKPNTADINDLYELHKQYEIEEVIPKNGEFNSASCRFAVQNMLVKNQVLVGEIDGRLAAKVNINADSYTRYQIGGVFVDPAFRCNGYASQVVSLFCEQLIAEGNGVTLFVNKTNAPAIKVYTKIGFEIISDYRITYY
jgi:ribosomal protein S18 acetylase RimI-like enzyme